MPNRGRSRAIGRGGYLNFALEAGILERGEITDLDVSMSRLLTAKVSARALGVTRQDAQQKFTDTNDDCVQALSEIGIIGGYPGRYVPSERLSDPRGAFCHRQPDLRLPVRPERAARRTIRTTRKI